LNSALKSIVNKRCICVVTLVVEIWSDNHVRHNDSRMAHINETPRYNDSITQTGCSLEEMESGGRICLQIRGWAFCQYMETQSKIGFISTKQSSLERYVISNHAIGFKYAIAYYRKRAGNDPLFSLKAPLSEVLTTLDRKVEKSSKIFKLRQTRQHVKTAVEDLILVRTSLETNLAGSLFGGSAMRDVCDYGYIADVTYMRQSNVCVS